MIVVFAFLFHHRDTNFHNDNDNDTCSFAPEDYLTTPNDNPALIVENENWDSNTKMLLHQAFKKLDERSQTIIKERWFVEKKATLEDLGEKLGVSVERIRQLEKQAITKLKTLIHDKLK